MWNVRLDESQAGITYLRYAADTTLTADREEELKSFNEGERTVNKVAESNIQKTKIMASGPITSQQVDGEKVETVTDFIFFGSKNHCGQWLQPWN